MDDLELQDEPLQIRLMDHDTYSANDAIGKVYLDLNPLLLTSSKGMRSAFIQTAAVDGKIQENCSDKHCYYYDLQIHQEN